MNTSSDIYRIAQFIDSQSDSVAVVMTMRDDEKDLFLHRLEGIVARRIVDVGNADEKLIAGAKQTLKELRRKRFVFESKLQVLSDQLDDAGISWIPLKGMDTSSRFFEDQDS